MKLLQSSELESIQELFELLQIKSDMWQSSEANKQSVDAWSHDEDDTARPVQVKKETDFGDDEEKKEDEMKDDEDDDKTQTSTSSERRSTSPNPVNLSLNTKATDDMSHKTDEDTDSQVILTSKYY